jgi:hypothetical protein
MTVARMSSIRGPHRQRCWITPVLFKSSDDAKECGVARSLGNAHKSRAKELLHEGDPYVG